MLRLVGTLIVLLLLVALVVFLLKHFYRFSIQAWEFLFYQKVENPKILNFERVCAVLLSPLTLIVSFSYLLGVWLTIKE